MLNTSFDNSCEQMKTKIFLMHNPRGVIDRDIVMAAQDGEFKIDSYGIDVTKSPEGHTVEKIKLLEVAERINRFNPSFVLCINGSGLDNEGLLALFCTYRKIPLVLWYVDEPFYIPEWGEKCIPEATVAFTFDRFYKDRLRRRGISWVYTLPLAANVKRLRGYRIGESETTKSRFEVAFVGGLDKEKIEYLIYNIQRSWPSTAGMLMSMLDEVVSEYRRDPMRKTEDVLNQCAARHSMSLEFPNGLVKQMVLSLIERRSSFDLRQGVVETVKPCGITIFGEPYWKKIVGEGGYGGRVDYYSDGIARVYASARVNLNISKYQLKTTVNQRVFDCPLCDGFLITDLREEIEEHFKIDKSVVVYRDVEDLKSKIEFYLGNSRKAQEITDRAKETIVERHSYVHRLEKMSEITKRIAASEEFVRVCERVGNSNKPMKFLRLLERLDARRQTRAIWESGDHVDQGREGLINPCSNIRDVTIHQ